MGWWARLAALTAAGLALLGTLAALAPTLDLPRAPRGTRDPVRGAGLPVAVVAPRLHPSEAAALDPLAQALGATPRPEPPGMHAAMEALERGPARGGVAAVLGGIPAGSPFAAQAAATRPLGPEGTVMLLPAGENALLLAARRALPAP